MKKITDVEVFESNDNELFAYGLAPKMLYSPDGKRFYDIERTRMVGTMVDHNITFKSDHPNLKGTFHRSGSLLEWNAKVFLKTVRILEVEIIQPPPPLPVREPEYLFLLPSRDEYLYVSDDAKSTDYNSFKLFHVSSSSSREIPITNVTRYSDGGTTKIYTPEGMLFSPTGIHPERQATWNETVKIKRLTYDNYNIEETGSTVTISLKKGYRQPD